jgi:hypothetical protein
MHRKFGQALLESALEWLTAKWRRFVVTLRKVQKQFAAREEKFDRAEADVAKVAHVASQIRQSDSCGRPWVFSRSDGRIRSVFEQSRGRLFKLLWRRFHGSRIPRPLRGPREHSHFRIGYRSECFRSPISGRAGRALIGPSRQQWATKVRWVIRFSSICRQYSHLHCLQLTHAITLSVIRITE